MELDHCPGCGLVLEHVQEALALRERALHDLEVERRIQRAKIARMREDRNAQQMLHPLREQAQEVFDYWKQQISPQAKEFKGERFEHVVARLKAGHSVETLKQAIDGARAKPYRSGRTDLLTICRSEPNLMMFLDFASEAGLSRNGSEPETAITIAEPREDEMAAAIASQQLKHLDSRALSGRLRALQGRERKVIETTLRLAARDVLERL